MPLVRINPPSLTPAETARFWARVVKSDGCWEWVRPTASGYGCFSVSGRAYMSHRIALALSGVDMTGLDGCHACHNKACVRPHPEHVHAGTPLDNRLDEFSKIGGDPRESMLPIGEIARTLGVARLDLRRAISRGQLAASVHLEWFVTEPELDRYQRAKVSAEG